MQVEICPCCGKLKRPRNFAAIVGEVAGVVSSPPYADGCVRTGGEDKNADRCKHRGINSGWDAYGQTPGQIGNLKAGSVDGVISSPPWADNCEGHVGSHKFGNAEAFADHMLEQDAKNPRVHARSKAALMASYERDNGKGYGTAPGNIGNLPAGNLDGIVSSPPYAATDTKPTKMGSGKGTRSDGDGAGRNKGDYHYPDSEGQIGSLPAGTLETCDGIVSSPPWDKSMNHDPGDNETTRQIGTSQRFAKYGDASGQIGNSTGETYWEAVRAVYASMHSAMKTGAVAALVCKDYVKAGKRVPLCDDTCRLLESLGFEVFERTRAWLVKTSSHPGLFGENVTRTKSRKSFFRRLAESKGSPEINWEEVIWSRKAVQ